MGKRPPPDPIAVLRGHRASVMDVCFHPSRPLAFTGSTDGELRIWDTIQHRTLTSAWVHSAAHGVIAVASSLSIGNNKVVSQGRDGTIKCWDIGDGAFSRDPLLTIKTDAYHFCKLSLVKRPVASIEKDGVRNCYNWDSNQTDDAEQLEASEIAAKGRSTECSDPPREEMHGGGAKYVAVAGQQSSQVEIWDLNTGDRCARLPQSSEGSSLSVSTKERGLGLGEDDWQC
ncbi:protein DECREASED SIZE EXCLUSION LIMIT 1 [Carica papaya]|uniref:protein DECREASED SIZE EXCLUSION LIMIT 1 n=1 Tax=Carica papaya TaxID=3649 RepID=UPI000B8CB5A5|nr:protein DECREASED SIZE EXCLUSION LIMIT 1 [Carica papaya]XP_021889682.1 protein DECREASED SIZE EXCLUSION LIMIT 1 [Carica papaya]